MPNPSILLTIAGFSVMLTCLGFASFGHIATAGSGLVVGMALFVKGSVGRH